jgi:hypothetical protein
MSFSGRGITAPAPGEADLLRPDPSLRSSVQVPVAKVLRRVGSGARGLPWCDWCPVPAGGPGATGVALRGEHRVPVAGTADVLLVTAELVGAPATGSGIEGRLVAARAGHLQHDVADGARDDRAHQDTGRGLGEQGLRGQAGASPHGVRCEGRDGETPSLLALLERRHLNSWVRQGSFKALGQPWAG